MIEKTTELEETLFNSDLVAKDDPVFKEGKVYTITRKGGPNKQDTKKQLNVFFLRKVKGQGPIKHYLFKSVEGGYTISYTNIEILQGDIKIS